jgi:hypothetical protein
VTTDTVTPAAADFAAAVRDLIKHHLMDKHIPDVDELASLIADAYWARLKPYVHRAQDAEEQCRTLVVQDRFRNEHMLQMVNSSRAATAGRERYTAYAQFLSDLLDRIATVLRKATEQDSEMVAIGEISSILQDRAYNPLGSAFPMPITIVTQNPAGDTSTRGIFAQDGHSFTFPRIGYSVVLNSNHGRSFVEPVFLVGGRPTVRSQLELDGYGFRGLQ